MSSENLLIIPTGLLHVYQECVDGVRLMQAFKQLKEAEVSTDTFSFYTSMSSVFSNKIEGEDIELDSYIKHKKYGIEFRPDYTRKIDDLYNAYFFAKTNKLSKDTKLGAHKLLSKNILSKSQQGKIRTQNMYVVTP